MLGILGTGDSIDRFMETGHVRTASTGVKARANPNRGKHGVVFVVPRVDRQHAL
jgi:hypothetical protein